MYPHRINETLYCGKSYRDEYSGKHRTSTFGRCVLNKKGDYIEDTPDKCATCKAYHREMQYRNRPKKKQYSKNKEKHKKNPKRTFKIPLALMRK